MDFHYILQKALVRIIKRYNLCEGYNLNKCFKTSRKLKYFKRTSKMH